jgi:hypothetical protein
MGKSSVSVSDWIPDILAELLREFPQPLKANCVIFPQVGHDPFPPNSSSIKHSSKVGTNFADKQWSLG